MSATPREPDMDETLVERVWALAGTYADMPTTPDRVLIYRGVADDLRALLVTPAPAPVGDDKGLAEVIRIAFLGMPRRGIYREAAEAILASDWLAGFAAAQRAEAEADRLLWHEAALMAAAGEGRAEGELADFRDRIEAAIRLIEPDHITPIGARVIRTALRGDQ